MGHFDDIWAAAQAAATKAGAKCKPTPMLAQQINPFSGAAVKTYDPVMDGACGFAWVNIRPANSPFARWLKQQNVGCKSHHGGWDVSIHAFDQSHARKTAAAHAMAAVLRAADIKAYAYDRLD